MGPDDDDDDDDDDSACFIKFALNNDVGLPTAPLVAIDKGPFAALCNAAAKAGIAPSSGKNLAVS